MSLPLCRLSLLLVAILFVHGGFIYCLLSIYSLSPFFITIFLFISSIVALKDSPNSNVLSDSQISIPGKVGPELS